MIELADVREAAGRIAPYLVRTPTADSPGLSELLGVPVTLKIETMQRTGSFKARGATVRLLSLGDKERAAGVVAVSGGNHGVAVAEMAAVLGVAATVVMPRSAPAGSIARCRAAGATVELTEDMPGAFSLVDELCGRGLTLLHPFDDDAVITGQGTVGLEFAEDAGDLTDVLVSIGGGGLISGVATAFAGLRPDVRIWGVEPSGARAMTDALAARSPVPTALSSVITTLSAPQTSGRTLEHARSLVHDVVLASDADAVRGTLEVADHAGVWTEPGDGILVPAARTVVERVGTDARLGLVLAGSNSTVAEVARLARDFGIWQLAEGT